MDFKYCYEKNGYKNDIGKLSNDWKAFIAGFLYAIDVIEDDELPTLSKIENDFFQTNSKYFLHRLKREYYNIVIKIMDNNWNEEKQCFESQEWETPAAPDDDNDDE